MYMNTNVLGVRSSQKVPGFGGVRQVAYGSRESAKQDRQMKQESHEIMVENAENVRLLHDAVFP
jgi:hypothetical protein